MHDSASPAALFRPVAMLRKRHDGWTPARQELFLIYLEQIGIVSAAAKAVGMSAKSAYALYNRSEAEAVHEAATESPSVSRFATATSPSQVDGEDYIPSFAEAWQLALYIGRGNARDLAISRAIQGEVRPVFYRGRQVGERVVYDNRLLNKALQLALKERKPVDRGALADFLNGDI